MFRILSQPASYPGKHNQSNPRTTQAKPLETHAQVPIYIYSIDVPDLESDTRIHKGEATEWKGKSFIIILTN